MEKCFSIVFINVALSCHLVTFLVNNDFDHSTICNAENNSL